MATVAASLDFQSELFKLFSINKSPWYFLSSFRSIGLSVQEKKSKIDFQDGGHDSHLGFLIGVILATFDLQVAQTLPTKVQLAFRFNFQDGGHGYAPILDCRFEWF